MKELAIEDFLKPCYDIELNQYRLLNKLKDIRSEFNKMKIFPYLTELIFISTQLENLVSIRTTPAQSDRYSIKEDYDINQLSEVIPELQQEDTENILEVILWVLPLLNDLIEEGFVINDFIEDNIEMKSVGKNPPLLSSGFFLINDQDEKYYNIYKYEFFRSSLIEGENELDSAFLERVSKREFYNGTSRFRKMFAEKYMFAPDAPMYIFDTKYKFPYYNAVLPLCRQKLMSYVSR